jgi:hypothetical protein
MPIIFMSGDSAAPMENSPPGIHTMPGGGFPGARCGFATVGWNVDAADTLVVGCERAAESHHATPPITASASSTRNFREV